MQSVNGRDKQDSLIFNYRYVLVAVARIKIKYIIRFIFDLKYY